MFNNFKLPFYCTLIWLFYSTPADTIPLTCTNANLPSSTTWFSDPQYPGICYSHFFGPDDIVGAANRCSKDFNATLPMFSTLDEFHSFQRLYLRLQNGYGDFTYNCGDENINVMLGLNITNYTIAWLDGNVIDPAFYIYDVKSDEANVSMVCLTGTMDLWLKRNPPKTCFYRCQLRVSNITVDPKTLSSLTSPSCPLGFYSYLNSNICYIFNSSRQMYNQAKQSCESLGATLPYFNTEWEYDNYYHVKISEIHAGCFRNMTDLWLGIKSALNVGNVGCCGFTDINDNPLTFTSWQTNPNCSANLCVVGDYDTKASWKPYDCAHHRPFYCQYRLDISSTNFLPIAETTPYPCATVEPKTFITQDVRNTEATTLITSLVSSKRASQVSLKSNATTILKNATISQEKTTSKGIGVRTSSTNVQNTIAKTQKMTSSTNQPLTLSENPTSNIPSTSKSSTTINISTTGIQKCTYNEWSSFSKCSSTCGAVSKKFRTRSENASNAFGKCLQQKETVPCKNLPACNPMSHIEFLIAKIISATGCSYIIGASAISFAASVALRSYTFERIILMCEELTLCFANVLVTTMSMRYDLAIPCRWSALGIQFFFTSLYIFTLIESLQSYAIYTNVISIGQIIPAKFALLFGFGLPLLITGLTGAIGFSNLTSPFSCFINWGSNISLASLIPVLITTIIAFVALESAGMGHFRHLPLTCEFQLHAAIVSRHALVFKLPLITASWFLMSMGIYSQNFLWFPNIFIINVALGCTIVAFHLLGNEKVVHVIRHVKERFLK